MVNKHKQRKTSKQNNNKNQSTNNIESFVPVNISEILTKKDRMANDSEVKKYTLDNLDFQQKIFEDISKANLKFLNLIDLEELKKMEEKSKEEFYKATDNKNIFIQLPLGLLNVFPLMSEFINVQYMKISNPFMKSYIDTINNIMRKFMYFKYFHSDYLLGGFRAIFQINVKDQTILTYEMVVKIYNDIIKFTANYCVSEIKRDYSDYLKIEATAEDILTKEELDSLEPDVLIHLNQFGPYVAADFVENIYFTHPTAEGYVLNLYNLYYFLLNREMLKIALAIRKFQHNAFPN